MADHYLDFLEKLTDESRKYDVPGLLDDLRVRLIERTRRSGGSDRSQASAALDALREAVDGIGMLVAHAEGGGPLALLDASSIRKYLGSLVDWKAAEKKVGDIYTARVPFVAPLSGDDTT